MGDRAQQRAPQPLGLDPELGRLRLLGQHRSLDGERRLVRERLEQVQLLGTVEGVGICRLHAEHPHRAARADERDIERRRPGQPLSGVQTGDRVITDGAVLLKGQ